MINMQGDYGRILALLILVLAMLLVWFGAARPYLNALAYYEESVHLSAGQLQSYRHPLQNGAGVSAGDNEALQALLLPGASSAAAAAWLQQRVGELTAGSGALLLSFELIQATAATEAPLEIVTGRIRLTANTQSLRALLHAAESQRPLLLIENLYVRARSDQDTVPGGHLDVQMDVAAARKAAP
jgi:general secretion pathway protein M